MLWWHLHSQATQEGSKPSVTLNIIFPLCPNCFRPGTFSKHNSVHMCSRVIMCYLCSVDHSSQGETFSTLEIVTSVTQTNYSGYEYNALVQGSTDLKALIPIIIGYLELLEGA